MFCHISTAFCSLYLQSQSLEWTMDAAMYDVPIDCSCITEC